jgi:hypothetical protein
LKIGIRALDAFPCRSDRDDPRKSEVSAVYRARRQLRSRLATATIEPQRQRLKIGDIPEEVRESVGKKVAGEAFRHTETPDQPKSL